MAIIDPDDPTKWFTNPGAVPGAPSVAPPPTFNIGDLGTPGSPEYRPDYQQLLLSDPLFSQQRSDLSAQSVQDAATRKASTSRAFQQFGEVPDFTGAIKGLGLDPNSPMYRMLFGDVDEATTRGAQDMTNSGLSTTAQLGREHSVNIGNLLDQLAARGSVRSGATGVGLGQEDQRYSGAQFGARSSLLDYLSGVQAAFAESERGRQGQLAQGAQDATARQIGLHPYVGAVPGSTPTQQQVDTSTFANPGVSSGGYGVAGPSDTAVGPPFNPDDFPQVQTPPAQPAQPSLAETLFSRLNL